MKLRRPMARLLITCGLLCGYLPLRSTAFNCHEGCHCIWRHGKMTATCTELGLITLPGDMDEGVQVLNMSMNNLKALQNNQIANSGLVHLQKLHLAQNQLREIQENAFFKMNNLVELDLSSNKLGAVPSTAFKHLVNLRQLLLKGNPIATLDDYSFGHLRALNILELSSCEISQISRDAFQQLESLQVLRIDDNLISFMSAAMMQPLGKLHGISLDGNSWNCDCRLRPFRDWLVLHHPTSYSPTCHLPETIRGLTWDKTPDAVFSCSPNFTVGAQDYKIQPGMNVTLHCEATGMPPPQIAWFFADSQQEAKTLLVNDSVTASNLLLSDISAVHTGTYTCRAQNSAGMMQHNYTVQVAAEGQENAHMAPTTKHISTLGITGDQGSQQYQGNAGLIGLVLGITTASLVVLSVFVLLLWVCRKNSHSIDKRKTPDATTSIAGGEVEPLKNVDTTEDLAPQKPPRSQTDYECLHPASLDLDTSMRTSTLYASNPYCCRDRRSIASCAPIPVPMPLLPGCATLPRDRRPLSLSPPEFGGQLPPDFASLRPLNLVNQGDLRDIYSDFRGLDLCNVNMRPLSPIRHQAYTGGQAKGPDLVSGSHGRQEALTPSQEAQEMCSLSQSSSTTPLLASPDLLVDQNDHPSAYFRAPSVLSTVPETAEPIAPDGTQV